jgi:Rrf2 family protein
MKLTTRSEYALLALIYLARRAGEGYIPLSKIAEAQKIPVKYLEQLANVMCHAGYLASAKGNRGGYKLARRPEKTSVAEVIRLFDGALAPDSSVSRYFYRPTPIEREKKMIRLLKDIRDYIAEKLEAQTLKDLV